MLPERAVDLDAGLAITVFACLNCGRRKAADQEPRPLTARHWPAMTEPKPLTSDEPQAASAAVSGALSHEGKSHVCSTAGLPLKRTGRYATPVIHSHRASRAWSGSPTSPASLHSSYMWLVIFTIEFSLR